VYVSLYEYLVTTTERTLNVRIISVSSLSCHLLIKRSLPNIFTPHDLRVQLIKVHEVVALKEAQVAELPVLVLQYEVSFQVLVQRAAQHLGGLA
jgi:hypothetical protein